MPPVAPIDADEVHVLDAGQANGARKGLISMLVALAVVSAVGAWVMITDPFASTSGGQAPAPDAENLLGAAWSFETTADSSPDDYWVAPAGAPAGFAFSAEAAVSGAAGAQAVQNEAGWSRIESRETWRVDGRADQVELTAVSSAPGLQLLVVFEGAAGSTIETVVASGSGALMGVATAPAGFQKMRVAIGCVGPGSVDDLSLRLVSGQGEGAAAEGSSPWLREIGVFDIVVGDPQAVSLFRGQDLVLRVEPLSLRSADGRALPPSAAQLPGQQALAYVDGSRVSVRSSVREEAQRLVLSQQLTGLASGTRSVRHAVVSGSLASAPVGVRSSRGYESFVGDFEMTGVDALLLGGTQDRLGLTADQPFDLSVVHRADGTVGLVIERNVSGDVSIEVTIQASFQDERVAAAGLADSAAEAEAQGALGLALGQLQQIIDVYPFDERVLAQAMSDRSRLAATMQVEIDTLQADLKDALFLGSAQRCEEVKDAALALAEIYTGSTARDQFLAQAEDVTVAGARLIAEYQARRRGRLQALLESYEAHGGYPGVSAELRAELAATPDGADAL